MRWWAVLGPPGSDAAFFGSLLGARLRAPLLSVRAAAAVETSHRTFLGSQLEAAAAANPGAMLPMQLVAQLTQRPLQDARERESGMILANFPRTLQQWRFLKTVAPAPSVILLTASEAELALSLIHI